MNDPGSFFTARHGDWAADVISNLFAPESILASALATYNAIFMAIGGTLLLWLMTRAVVETAQHGKLAGRHSEVWFPIRFFLAVGLMVPAPPIGLNAAEYIVIGVARMGVAAGGVIWGTAVQSTASLQPLALPLEPDVQALAKGLFRMQACKAMQNRAAAASEGVVIDIKIHEFDDRTVLSADGGPQGGVPGQCGAVTLSKLSFAQTGDGKVMHVLTAQMLKEHTALAMRMLSRFEAPASELAMHLTPPFTENTTRPPSVDFAGAMREYQNGMMRLAALLVDTTNASAASNRSAFAQEATDGGWAMAGAWAWRLAAANEQLIRATGAVPQVAPPKGEWWSAEVYQAQYAALAGIDQWLDQQFRRQLPAEDGNAYAVGVDGDFLATYLSPARFKALYSPFLVTDERSANPMGEMVRTGHGILAAVWSTYAGYVAAKTTAATIHDGATNNLVGLVLNTGSGGSVSMLAKASLVVIESAGPGLFFALFALFVAGAFLAYILPVWPFLIWFYAVVQYLVKTAFGVVAAPAWGVSHLALEGDGIGDRARGGYHLLLDLLIRPMVMTLGLVVGYAAMLFSGQLFARSYFIAIENSLSGHFGGVTGLLVYTLVGAGAIVGLVPLCFWLVSKGTDAVLELVGIRSTNVGDAERDAHNAAAGAKSNTDRTSNDARMGAGRRPPPSDPKSLRADTAGGSYAKFEDIQRADAPARFGRPPD